MPAPCSLSPLSKALRLNLAFRRTLSPQTLALAMAFSLVSHVQAADRDFNIPGQSLSSAIQAFGQAANIQVLYNPQDLTGLRSNAVKGRLSTEQAMTTLLQGTGISYRMDGNTLILSANKHDGDTVQLGETDIVGQFAGTTTEGTGSYTTKATSAATGLTLSPRETPQSVSVLSRQRIDDQNLVTVADILGNAPGIATLQLDSERTVFSSRGFSINNFQYDGISSYYKSNYAAGESELDSSIYDRVEIVRGSTGLLAGAGEPSASVNLVRKRADSREFQGEAQISAGSWDNYRSMLDLSGPLTSTGNVRGRLVGAYQDKKAFFDRYSRQTQVLYGVVDADLTDATTLSLGASYQKSNANGLTYGGVPLWYKDGSRTNFSRSFTVAPKWNSEDVEVENVFINLDHRFDNDWKAQAQIMYGRNRVDNARMFVWGFPDRETGLIADEPSRVRFPGEREQDSYDLRFSGPFQLLGREHEAIIGTSYFDQDYSYDWIGANTPWNSPLNVADFGHVAKPDWDYASRELSERNHTKQAAAYGALRFSLADPLKLILGGRFTRYEREGAGWASSGAFEYQDHKFIPYAGLVYNINQTYSVYASYTSIFNFQDYRDRNGGWLEPVTGDAYETGIKGEFFDGRLNASLAAFKIVQDKLGQQDTGYLVPGTDSPAYYSTDGATSKGLELEISGELAPGWQAFFFATHYSAKDAEHQQVNTYLPRTMVRLFTTYQLPGAWHQLTVGGGTNWQSRIYYDNVGPNGERQEQSGYLLASLMARYDITPQLSAQMNVNNLFDKEYQTAVNWYGQGIWGTPRNVEASLSYKF
nr:ferric-rhodotorulic acid/ferric-coprogen receptor FhuE [Pseudomonas psychrotolerans]